MTLVLRNGVLATLVAALASGAAVACAAQEGQPGGMVEIVSRLGGLLGPKVLEETPDWARIEQKPLFTFAWASDLHLDQARRERIERALGFVDRELKPDFVLLTGDNNALAAPADPRSPEPIGLRRQRFLKTWLAEHLKAPPVVIPGDNWPQDFEKVFGPAQLSFDYGGLHFLLTAPDRSYHGKRMEGLSVFDERTWQWMRRDLEKNRDRPVVVALHEPIFPPTFLEAKRLRGLLRRYPNVIAVLQGHLHADMELPADGRTYLVAPALGPGHPPAMKHVLVYPHALIVRTVEHDKTADRFRLVAKWQKIDVPKPLQARLKRPPPRGFRKERYDFVPPHPYRDAPELADRLGELTSILQEFVGKELPPLVLRAATGR